MIKGNIVKDVHVGEALREWCKRNNLTRQKLADTVELPKSNIDRVFSKQSIEISKLVAFSKKLGHNFFAEFWSDKNYEDLKTEIGFLEIPPESLNIGTSIGGYMLAKHIPQIQLANALGVTHPVVSKLLRRESIETGKLEEISNFLHRDFFVEFYMLHRMKGMKETLDPIIPVEENKTTEPLETILKRNEELVAENARMKEYLREVYSKMQQFKEDNDISIENWDSLMKREGVDVMNMASFFFLDANIKKYLDELEQKDSSDSPENDK